MKAPQEIFASSNNWNEANTFSTMLLNIFKTALGELLAPSFDILSLHLVCNLHIPLTTLPYTERLPF